MLIDVLEYGEVYSFGDGESHQLGYSAQGSNPIPKRIDALKGVNVKKIACGTMHNFVIDDKGALYSWGSGHYAQHGHEQPDSILYPQLVKSFIDRPVELVAAGLYHSVVVTQAQEVLFFGGHKTKLPGSGVHRVSFVLQPSPIKDLELIEPGEKWIHLSTGITHNVISSNKGRTLAWGLNHNHAVGSDSSAFNRAVQLEELNGVVFDNFTSGPYHNIGFDTKGNCWGWGQGTDYQLGSLRSSIAVPTMIDVGLPQNMTGHKVAAGWAHTLIIAGYKDDAVTQQL